MAVQPPKILNIDVDVPLEAFGGLVTELTPADIPMGASPFAQDVDYQLGAVFTRAGLTAQLGSSFIGTVNHLKTFTLPNTNDELLILDGGGNFYFEDTTNAPGVPSLIGTVTPGSFANSVTQFGREFLAFNDGSWGFDAPRQWDGTFFDRVSQDGPGAAPTVVDSGSAGNITAGVHKFVQIFLTREGYLTAPSPIGNWTAGGAKQANVSVLAIGPSNIVARWLAFTSAAGGFFFAIPIPVTGSTTGTVVADNTSTTFAVDFTDTALLDAFSIDSAGNNLFNLVVLGPAAGVISYSNRMFWWGERNKIQNLLNMHFDGAFDPTNTFPLGWAVSASSGGGGSRAVPSQITGFAYKMTSAGVGGTHYGSIEQSVFQDSFNVQIVAPNTAYSVRMAAISGIANAGGSLIFELFSASLGSLATATIPINSIAIVSGYFSAAFSAKTPAVIPSDAVLRVYIINTANLETVTIDEVDVFPTNVPYISTTLRASYNSNPESFDGSTGRIGVSNLDGQAIKACFQLRDILYIVKEGSLYATQDNGSTEPFGWTVSTISKAVGTPSLRGVAVAEEYAFIVNQMGVYMFNGSEPIRVNQEIKPVSGLGQGWDSINWQFGSRIWVTLDINNRHLLIGAPTGNSQVPNQIFMMNYRELDESYAVANQKAVHMSYTGKMVSWDMSRKWAQWTISANCAAIVRRQNLSLQVWFGNNAGTGKLYQLDPANGTDDGVAIQSQYYTFFFVNREMEQGLQVGSHRHLYTYLAAFSSGVGILSLTAVADSLTSTRTQALAPRSLSSNPGYDLEAGINFSADRVAFKFATDGQAGSTFFLSKLTVTMKSDPWAPVRGRV